MLSTVVILTLNARKLSQSSRSPLVSVELGILTPLPSASLCTASKHYGLHCSKAPLGGLFLPQPWSEATSARGWVWVCWFLRTHKQSMASLPVEALGGTDKQGG